MQTQDWMPILKAVHIVGCSRKTMDRHSKKGTVKSKQIKGKTYIYAPDLINIGATIKKAQKRYNKKPKEKVAEPTQKELSPRELKSVGLNVYGTQLMNETIQVLESNNLLKMVPQSIIMNYTRHRMMVDKHMMIAAASNDDLEIKTHTDIATKLQKTVQHYETQLGLTPAALMKIKPPEDEIEVDSLEALLNG